MLFKRRRRKKLADGPFPSEWLAILEGKVPLYAGLSEPDRAELRRHMLVFLAEKRFEGCAGLEITDEMRVVIAAHACLLLLHRKTDYYPGLKTILVYPDAFVVPDVHHHIGDMVLESDDVRLGESWPDGSVVLSWNDMVDDAGARDGQNLALHEFAHQLDSSGGRGDSTPVLRDQASFDAWARALGEDYDRFRRAVRRRRPEVLDEYGATDPAEFFAVATESFFENPGGLRGGYPRLYDELRKFYQQDPASWGPA
ncbi:MAG TPA: zinc-dependent peptidase [Sedimentisphaerales bacterium]|jgi:Mlc titration factor MtfA (ptsG expression regulator)|nr:zinc-dependent peptidase [Sedimentisphaerales bacterium]HNU29964.1 zinc-dependent peptidase [Sedimentisphaerales bacterium]